MADNVLDDAALTRLKDELLRKRGEILAASTGTRALPESAGAVVLVGHNPAVEEFVETLTGEYAALPTSAVAVVEVASWAGVGPGTGRLLANLRPADAELPDTELPGTD